MRRVSATRETLAWCAGVLDAKGSVADRGRSVRLSVSSHDRLLVDRLAGVLGGSVLGPYENRNADGITRRPRYVWHVDGVVAVLTLSRRLRRWLSPATRDRIDAVLGAVQERKHSRGA